MKRIYLYQLFTLIILSLTACNKQLDLSPENDLVESQVLEDKTTTERLLAGGFFSQFLVERNALQIADYSTGNLTLTNNYYYTGAIDPNLASIYDIWNGHYKVINIANVIINNLPAQAKFDVVLQKQFIAEARFLRAFSYFKLAVLFGDRWYNHHLGDAYPCVPLRLEAFVRSDETQLIPRSNNKAVFDQIINDMEMAITDLPGSFPEASAPDVKLRSRAVKAVGRAFLSRVYLYLENYDLAISNADLVLSDANYALASSADVVFPNNLSVVSGPANIPFNKEVVYGYPVSWNLSANGNTANNFQSLTDRSFPGTFNLNDMRGSTMIRVATNGDLRSNKYTSPNLFDNMMIIRLAEVMLNKAEALARRDGVNQVSVDILNSIYQRAFVAGKKPVLYTMTSFGSKEQLIDRLLQERQWELAFEGHDRFDKLRSGKMVNAVMPADKYPLPIPQAEINLTSGLITQNPHY